MADSAFLEGRGIDVKFTTRSGSVDAVLGATVRVDEGEAVGIVGESGSGKTTLARVLVGLLPPLNGEVIVDGISIHQERSSRLVKRARRHVQMVFQDPYSSLNPRMSPMAAVTEAVRFAGGSRSRMAAKAEAQDLLESVGIDSKQARRLPRTLSGGQLQRVSIARALAAQPKVLIADEPTSSLDQSVQARLLNLLRSLKRERGLSVVLISHDLSVVKYLTTRVYVMRGGSIVEEGLTNEVLRQPRDAYTKQLIASIPGSI